MKSKWRNKVPPQKTKSLYRKIWRLADGAVMDTLRAHPEYFTERGRGKIARMSIVKRVTGSVMGFAEQSAKGRSDESRRLI